MRLESRDRGLSRKLLPPCASSAACCLALLLTACGAGTGAAPATAGARAAPFEEAWRAEVLHLTNAERARHGLPPLRLDETASRAADEHAWDMYARGFLAHVNPDAEGPGARLTRHGVEWALASENIARGHESPKAVVGGWMGSPSHRANILDPAWTHVGIGVHTGPDGGPWWTQDFFQ